MGDFRASRKYRFAIYESNLANDDTHPVTGLSTPGIHTRVRDITTVASNKSVTHRLNSGGEAKFTVPLSSQAALEIVGYELARCLVIFNDDADGNLTVRWTGYIASVSIDSDSDQVQVSCLGWADLLDRRELRQPVTFTNIDAGVIASRLLSTANNQIVNTNTLSTDRGSGYARSGVDSYATNAEDLLFGAGELDNYDPEHISYPATPAGNLPPHAVVNMDTGFPKITNDWAESGSGALAVSSTNRNGSSFVRLTPPTQFRANSSSFEPGYDSTGNSEFMLTANTGVEKTIYVRAKLKIVSVTGGAFVRVDMDNWYGSLLSQIATTYGAQYNTVGEHDLLLAFSFTNQRPSILLETYSGSSGSSIVAYWDNITVTQGAPPTEVPTPIEIGTIASPANPAGANRTRKYQKGQKIGSAIKELSQVEAGFDYEVKSTMETVSAGALTGFTIRRYFNVYYGVVKSGTTINGRGSDKQNVVFGYKWGNNNVAKISVRRDSANLVNRVNARAGSQSVMAQDASSIAFYGLMEESSSISDANLVDRVLLGVAGAELYFRKQPLQTYDIQPFPWDGAINSRAYRFGIDYDLGDICYLVARSGALKIGIGAHQAIRIFGVTINIDREGNERVENILTVAS